MKINWLIEDGPFDEELAPLVQAIKEQGFNYQFVKYEPFQSGTYRHLYEDDACIIFYGSINLALQLQRETPWVPGPLVNFDNYRCSTYYAYWGRYLLNSDYQFLPYAEFLRKYKNHKSIWIRPDDGKKSFGGHVVTKRDMNVIDGPVGQWCKPHDLIVCAIPKEIEYEWRLVIADRKVISGSQYKYCDNLDLSSHVPDEVIDYAEEIANSTKWQPDRVYTLDICSSEGQLNLLEANSFCCAGLYATPMEPVVPEVSRIALEEWKIVYEE